MGKEIVFDIETSNSFADVGRYDPSLLKVSLVGVYSYDTDTYETFLEPDLPRLWRIFENADRIIGYNILGFDYPVLNTYYPGDLTRFRSLDLLKEIEGQLGFRIKLDNVAQTSLGVGKTGDGLQAIEFFRRGEIEKLKEYCLQDVKVTKEVYEFGLENGFVKFRERSGEEVKVPVDFALKEDRVRPVNLTMPF
ncbi:hypothetical protein AMJ57_00865 [Parcubacteria bacterium SG8_24]|nr:MAG: hypothetical protein AMJ57_00865 [Parcubacteria bacterium SG8_24]